MAIKTYSDTPYHDDFSTDKNFLRILFRPGRSVQVRELNQLQSNVQDQIDKFGRHVFKDGDRVLDGYTNYDEGIQSAPIRFINDNITTAELNALKGKEVVKNGATNLRAKIVGVETTSIGNNNYRLYLRYGGEATAGGTKEFANGDQINLATGEDTITIGGTSVTDTDEIGDITNEEATGDYGGFFQDEGVFFVKGHFVHTDAQETFQIKGSSGKLTGDVFFDVTETIVTSTDDTSLLDNATGQPNINAPGADRYKIALTLKFVLSSDSTPVADGQQRVHLLEVVEDKVTAPVRTEYGELGKFIAQRTEEESGSYTLNPFQHDIREYRNDEAGNRGKFTDAEIIAAESSVTNATEAQEFGNKRYVVGIEPSTAYVQGYRVELENKQDVTLDKGRETADKVTKSDYKIAARRGFFIEGAFFDDNDLAHMPVNALDKLRFSPDKTYNFYNASDEATEIGSCRIQAIEQTGVGEENANHGGTGSSQATITADKATKRIYIYDINMVAGKTIADANRLLLLYDGTTSANATPLVNNDGFTLFEADDNDSRMVYPLGGFSVEDVNATNTKYTRQVRLYQEDPADQNVTFAAPSGTKFVSTDPDDYVVMQEGESFQHDLCETFVKRVELLSGGNSVKLHFHNPSNTGGQIDTGAGNDIVVHAPAEQTSGTLKTKTKTIGSMSIISTSLNPGTVLELDHVDVYEITSVTCDFNSPATDDIKNLFTLETGQEDTHYGKSRIVYNGPPISRFSTVVVTYNRWAHGAGHFFAANSYKDTDGSTQIALEDIPKYEDLRLSNCVDFRPAVTDTAEDTGIRPGTTITVEFDHFLPRRDLVVLDQLGDIKVIAGKANETPAYPQVPSDSIPLLQINKPGYVYSLDDLTVTTTDHRRYTMRDIGDLENRIQNLEYYTALNALENEAAGIQIQDSNGERFKAGILTDGFSGHGVGDVNDPAYKIAIDRENFSARPTYLSDNTRWSYVSGLQATATTSSSANWNGNDEGTVTIYSGKRGNSVVCDYIEKTLIDQPYASGHISVNPYDVTTWSGTLELSPSSDEWKDVNHVPDIIQNVEGDNSALLNQIANNPNILGTEWNEWSVNWVGRRTGRWWNRRWRRVKDTFNQSTRIDRRTRRIDTFQRESRDGIQTTLGENFQREVIDDKLLNTTFIPFIRSRKVYFKARLLKPRTKYYLFMDDVNITSYATDNDSFEQFGGGIASSGGTDVERFDGKLHGAITGADGGIVTDAAGDVEGWVVIPNNDTLRFRTGSRQIRITDSSVNNRVLELSSAETTYHAKGLLETRQRTILSTRQLVLERTRVTQDRNTLVKSRVVRRDPIAQTFTIGNEPTGIFLSSVDIFFQKKDPNLPIELSIVSVENGIPTQRTIPFSRVIKSAGDVSVDANNAQTATTFRFDTPVYLEPGIEYAIVLISNSARYRAWFAEPGKRNKVASGNAELITKNVNLGVLLKSQNASTWTPDQNKDLKFKFKRADFNTSSVDVTFTGVCPQRGQVTYIDLDSPGQGYIAGAPTITVGNPLTGSDVATAKAYIGKGGTLDTIEVITNGSEYDSPGGTMPTVTIGEAPRIQVDLNQVDVDTNDDVITLDVGLSKVKNGQPLTYNSGLNSPATVIGGLTNGQLVYAEAVEQTGTGANSWKTVDYSHNIRLHTNSSLSGLIDLTSTGNNQQYFITASPIPTATAKTDTWNASQYLPIIQDMLLPETSVDYKLHTSSSSNYDVFPGELLYTTERVEHDKRSGSSGSGADLLKLVATLSTTDSKLSPVIDLDRMSLTTFDNIITNSSEYEEYHNAGEAAARYVSQKIILENPADQVNVYLDVMKPDDSTEVEVYAKYGFLDGTPFATQRWYKLNPASGNKKIPISTNFEFKQVKYEATSTDIGDEFNKLSIKIILKSSDKAYAPEIKNLRVIATS